MSEKNSRPIKIGIIISTYYPAWGGAQRQLKQICNILKEKNVEFFILTRRLPHTKKAEILDGIPVRRIFVTNRSQVIDSLCFVFFSCLWLLKNRKKYDLLYCYQMYSPTTIGVFVKTIFREKKVVVKVTSSNEYGEVKEIKRLSFFNFRKKILSKVDRFIFINPQVKNELMGIGIKESRMQYIPNGVNIINQSAFNKENKSLIRNKLDLAYNRIGIYVGRLSEEKSLETLLTAWKNNHKTFPDAHLLFLGEGGDFRNVEGHLKNSVNELGLDGIVHFLGKKDNVFDYLLASDIFILPSISEGMSNALLEAMSAGLAVIASNIDANRHIIQDGVNGLLFERDDSDELSRLIEMVFNSHDMAEKLGRQAQDSVLKNYSIDSVAKKYVLLYNELTS